MQRLPWPLKNTMNQGLGHSTNWMFVPKGTLQSVESASEKVRWGYPFGFQGQEKDNEVYGAEGTSYTAEFWQYDPRTGRRWNLDPMSRVAPAWSPYRAFYCNPISTTDPNGALEHTDVTANKDGTYTVVGGDANDGDKSINIVDEKGKTTGKLGESLTTHSFADANGDIVTGAVINPNSSEGQNFIDHEIVDANPSLIGYMYNAQNGHDYDIKDRGIENRGELSMQQYRYRGSRASNGEYGSARDFGNIGAGIVAARKGLTWERARSGFDAYQGSVEPATTQLAQRFGFKIGLELKSADDIHRMNLIKNNPGRFNPFEPKF